MTTYVRTGFGSTLGVTDSAGAVLIRGLKRRWCRQIDVSGCAVGAGITGMFGQRTYVVAGTADLVVQESSRKTAQRLLGNYIIDMNSMGTGSRGPAVTSAAALLFYNAVNVQSGSAECSRGGHMVMAAVTLIDVVYARMAAGCGGRRGVTLAAVAGQAGSAGQISGIVPDDGSICRRRSGIGGSAIMAIGVGAGPCGGIVTRSGSGAGISLGAKCYGSATIHMSGKGSARCVDVGVTFRTSDRVGNRIYSAQMGIMGANLGIRGNSCAAGIAAGTIISRCSSLGISSIGSRCCVIYTVTFCAAGLCGVGPPCRAGCPVAGRSVAGGKRRRGIGYSPTGAFGVGTAADWRCHVDNTI